MGRVALPGTCGELVQGTWDGVACLVSCPIDRYSVATVALLPQTDWTWPPAMPKTRAALQAGLGYLRKSAYGGWLRIHSTLPQGRGYGSSTADIGAALYALGYAAGTPLAPLAVAKLAVQVEPTDSSLLPGLALWDHRNGQLYSDLGVPPSLTVIVLDPGGEVDTLRFNRCDHRAALQTLAPVHREAFTVLQEGVRYGNLEAIGTAATLSATAHQIILYNPLLDLALSLSREIGAVGLCRAHSGTILGVLLDPRRTSILHAVAYLKGRLGHNVHVFSVPLVNGGPRSLPVTLSD
jgi:L-threonine kinase